MNPYLPGTDWLPKRGRGHPRRVVWLVEGPPGRTLKLICYFSPATIDEPGQDRPYYVPAGARCVAAETFKRWAGDPATPAKNRGT